MLAGFHYPQKLQACTNPASSQQRHTQRQVCLPAAPGLPAGDDARALGSLGGWGRSINGIFLKAIFLKGSVFTLIGFQAEQRLFNCYEKTQGDTWGLLHKPQQELTSEQK